jgi:fluoroacetyl-CoA thioesterase
LITFFIADSVVSRVVVNEAKHLRLRKLSRNAAATIRHGRARRNRAPRRLAVRRRGAILRTMNDHAVLAPGLKGTAELVVGEEHTAPRVGSGKIHVLATPVMINVIEAAALAAVEHLLPPGHQSLGTHLDVKHVAATPVGMKIRAVAEVISVEGRIIRFRVTAEDEREEIGGGEHERVVVNVERFDRRVQKKIAGA